jgi:crotonobetainyl-CoA:carnitine CoA-transferase CaiB-like acyl-CoA transferase
VKLLDFGQYLAGPFGPMVLADLGAQVVKIEPVFGDGMRQAQKPFFGCQRGKRSLALDLKQPAGIDLALKLVGGADIVHHNMTRGVATRLGLDYEACRAARADVIYCNTYAYGLPDPLGRFGGLDPLYQASAGLEHENAAVHLGNAPLYYRFGMCDASNALLSAVGMLLALYHRQRTGEGQELWTSLHDGGLIFSSDVWLGPDGVAWRGRPRMDKDLMGTSALCRLYRTIDDGWICIAAERDAEWAALCRAVGVPHLLDDERLATAAGRATHREAIEAVLEPAFRRRTAWFWTTALDDHGVPNEIPLDTHAGRVALHDADNVRLGLVTEYEHPLLGRLRQFGHLITFSETPGKIWGPPPLVGQHSREILHEIGLRDGDVDALVASKVVYEPDEHYRERFVN